MLQAGLPLKDGDLVVRHVASLALPSFLTSVAISTCQLQGLIVGYLVASQGLCYDLVG